MNNLILDPDYHNVLNMMRAAFYSIFFFGFRNFKFTKSFSMKMKLRYALYFLLAAVIFCLRQI